MIYISNMRVTRKDVAREANVSETIVSYVVNNNRYVAKDKKSRVLAAIEKLNYVPNATARSLKGKNTNHILLLTDNIQLDYSTKLLNQLYLEDTEGVFIFSLSKIKNDIKFIDRLMTSSVDGIIIDSPTLERDKIDLIVNSGIPIVLIMNSIEDKIFNIPRINAGTYKGMENVVTFLRNMDMNNILFIDSNHTEIKNRSFRTQAFLDFKDARPLDLSKKLINIGINPFIFEALIRKELDNHEYDAIICFNDQIGLITKKISDEIYKVTNNKVKIVCFDNSFFTRAFNITAVEIDIENIARQIINIFSRIKNNEKNNLVFSFSTKIIERGSTNNSN